MSDGDESDVCEFAFISEIFVKFRDFRVASDCPY